MREIIKVGGKCILPVQNLKVQKYDFKSWEWHNIMLADDNSEYKAEFTLEAGDVYTDDGNLIKNFSVYLSDNPFANEICLSATIDISGMLEISFIRHKIIIHPDTNYETWNFGDSNGVRIWCLPEGKFMTIGLGDLFI